MIARAAPGRPKPCATPSGVRSRHAVNGGLT